jgi:hypothetical protein
MFYHARSPVEFELGIALYSRGSRKRQIYNTGVGEGEEPNIISELLIERA